MGLSNSLASQDCSLLKWNIAKFYTLRCELETHWHPRTEFTLKLEYISQNNYSIHLDYLELHLLTLKLYSNKHMCFKCLLSWTWFVCMTLSDSPGGIPGLFTLDWNITKFHAVLILIRNMLTSKGWVLH